MTKADAERWYRQWYAPNHAVLIVAGDVDSETVFALAKKYYGRHQPDNAFTSLVNRENPTFRGMRRVEIKHPQVELPAVNIAFPAPSLADVETSDDVYALAMLEAVLDAGKFARLEKNLIREKRIARMAWASYSYIRRGPALFTLGAAPSEGHSIEEVETALRAEIKKIADKGVESAEFERIKAGIVADQQYHRDSLVNRVNLIGSLVMVGLPADSLDAILGKLQQVTNSQVQAVAKKYFDADLSTVVILRTEESPVLSSPNAIPAARTSHRH